MPTMTPAEIKALRAALGLSREKFAALVGVAAFTVYRWEMGQKPSHLAELRLEALRKSAKRE